ncbi:MAG: hypothetical protein A3I06_12170 [Candidatus Lindowbacteria bacterium RIFCSPLOWO2_02_FULL_62_12]|nr:MAG: hypothetical protein A3I06_12170 [Candidatus Lindowbacteria bacterium RIFCSPLOWO2_02_FULL_62_12]
MAAKTVLVLIDGVRYDALFKVNDWVGLPNMRGILNDGVLWRNVYTLEPFLTNHITQKILTGHQHYTQNYTIFQRLEYLGFRTASVGTNPWDGRGARFNFDNLYDKEHNSQSDDVRFDCACRILPKVDFVYLYTVETDEYAHVCRDAHRNIYSWESPYIWAIKRTDTRLGRLRGWLEKITRGHYNLICVADHGMTDNGRHSIGTWTMEAVTHVPVFACGVNFKRGAKVDARFYVTDLAHAIVNLYDARVPAHMFNSVLSRAAAMPAVRS